MDIYLCTHHNRRPDECPKAHIIYHEVLYLYVLEQIRALARSMKRRKVNTQICRFMDIQDVTQEVLHEVVDRIEIGNSLRRKENKRNVRIVWRLR